MRIDHVLEPRLHLDLAAVPPVRLNALDTPTLADLAPVVDGKPNADQIATIDLEDLGRRQRWQRIVFQVARDVYEVMQPSWSGNREVLLGQVVQLVEQYVRRGPIEIHPQSFAQDDLRRRILLTLNLSKLVNHAWHAISSENTVQLTPVFDTERPIRSTGDMMPWYTGKPCWKTEKSHINFCVFDSSWEATESFRLERSAHVGAWAKNDHLGFEVLYLFNGVVHKYRPDFLVRLTNGTMLVLEVKGKDSEQDRTKRAFLQEWVEAVNSHGGFGRWTSDVSFEPGDVVDILERHASKAGA